MNYDQAYAFLIDKLEKGLPAYISYHDSTHTKNVINAVVHIAHKENLEGEDLTILKTAALFHDAGFLKNQDGHEKISCEMAREYLPSFGYSKDQIENICKLILTTHLPQSAFDLSSQILCDADLYYLGSDEYFIYADKLFVEAKKNGVVKTDTEWILNQILFLKEHKFLTNTAISEREDLKQKHVEVLENQLLEIQKVVTKPKPHSLIKDTFLILAGVTMAGFALKGFLVPNHFFDGGVTGISLLIHELFGFNLPLVNLLINLPFVIVSFFTVGKQFAIRTFSSIILLSLALYLLPDIALTQDKLLISIFGGVFLGMGVGFVMRVGAALDGIEVLALYTLKRTSFTITEIIFGINVIIFSIAAFKFGIETSLYSMLTYFAATRTIDYVVEGIQAYTGVTIISGKSEIIKFHLVNKLGRAITVYKGERGFLPGKFEVSSDCDIIFTVVTRLEMRKLKNLVYELDPNAFVFVQTIKEALGGVIKKRHSH